MTLNLPLLYFVWTEEYCQTSPNKNKSSNLWHVTRILVCCIFAYGSLDFFLCSPDCPKQPSAEFIICFICRFLYPMICGTTYMYLGLYTFCATKCTDRNKIRIKIWSPRIIYSFMLLVYFCFFRVASKLKEKVKSPVHCFVERKFT